MGTTTGSAITIALTGIGNCVTSVVDWAGDVIGLVTDYPILLLFVVFGFAFAGVGLIKKLKNI